MFYSRRSRGSSLPRFTVMCIVGLGLSSYLVWTGKPTKAFVMLSATFLCGAYAGWQVWKLGSWVAVQEVFLRRWEQLKGSEVER